MKILRNQFPAWHWITFSLVIVLTGCVTKKQVEQIVDQSNAEIIAGQFEGGPDAEEKILNFIERNPDLTAVNQRLLVRLGVLYMADSKPNHALAAFEEAGQIGDISQLGERDRMLVELRGPLVWRQTLGDPISDANLQAAPGYHAQLRQYLDDHNDLNDQLKAMVLDTEISVAPLLPTGFDDEQDTEQVRELRDTLQASMTDYTAFWGEQQHRETVQFLRGGSTESCVTDSSQVSFRNLDPSTLPDLRLLRFAGSVYCNVEALLEQHQKLMTAYRFQDQQSNQLGGQEQALLRKPLNTPDWMNCVQEADKTDFTCSAS
ncbi:hypothetical protein [Ruegeria jejuensis]|uniref:hypothetical protein n=1 Tax=Ruegeria jejuensis TaxID=3233338 RepID=UPI00355BF833